MGKLVSFDYINEENSPKSVIVDTNFLLNFTHHITKFPLSNRKGYDQINRLRLECEDFLKKCIDYKTRVIICDVVFSEFCHEIYKDVLKEKNYMGWFPLYKKRPDLIAKGHPIIEKAYKSFKPFFHEELIQVGEKIRNTAWGIMKRFHMCPNDSYIASIAIENNIDGVASFDVTDFKRILEDCPVNIYLPKELIH